MYEIFIINTSITNIQQKGELQLKILNCNEFNRLRWYLHQLKSTKHHRITFILYIYFFLSCHICIS